MDNCMLVSKPSLHLAGISYSGPYSTFPDEAIRLQGDFVARKHELHENIKSPALYSPYFGNEVFVTYWACSEVSRLDAIPEGMVQFTIPEQEYAMITTTNKRIGEAYEQLFGWMKEKQLVKEENSPAMEVFYIDDHLDEEPVEIWIPVKSRER